MELSMSFPGKSTAEANELAADLNRNAYRLKVFAIQKRR